MNLESWFKDKIIVQTVIGVSSSGQPTYGVKEVVKCRVEHDMKKIVDSSGQEKVSDAQVAIPKAIGLLDRIWLPGIEKEPISLALETLVRVTDISWQIGDVEKRILDPDIAVVLERFVAGVGEDPGEWVETAYESVDKSLGIFTFTAPGYEAGRNIRVKSGNYLDYLVWRARTAQAYKEADSKHGQTTMRMLYL